MLYMLKLEQTSATMLETRNLGWFLWLNGSDVDLFIQDTTNYQALDRFLAPELCHSSLVTSVKN